MSDEISADVGLDVTADEPADSAPAAQISDEIFNGQQGASAEEATDEILGDQSASDGAPDAERAVTDNDTLLTDGGPGTRQETAAPDVASDARHSGSADSAPPPTDAPEPPPPPDAQAPGGGPAESSGTYTAGGDLSLTIDGQTYDVGAPTLDFSGAGVADTVAVERDGNVEYYVDSDQDGVADQIIVLDEANGALINHEVYDPATGTWDNVTDESK